MIYCAWFCVLLHLVSENTLQADVLTNQKQESALLKSRGMNVLFLMVDDLRVELNSYVGLKGADPSPYHPQLHTPHTDKLAKSSLMFQAAHTQYTLCGPSRASMLTSRRPDTTGVYHCKSNFRETGGNFTTLPQYFMQHGYTTLGVGKIFHQLGPVKYDKVSFQDYKYAHTHRYWVRKRSWEAITEEQLRQLPTDDDLSVDAAVTYIRQLANGTSKRPFFLAVGFNRPHVPWTVPKRFYDLYSKQSIKLSQNRYLPKNYPKISSAYPLSMCLYDDVIATGATCQSNTTLPDFKERECRKAYYASVSYADHNVGMVLEELERQGLSHKTIVVFVSDHGFHLGENMRWGKNSNFQLATQVPLLIKVPGLTDTGLTTKKIVELVDLYPTLVDLVGLPRMPQCSPEVAQSRKTEICTEGRSLLPLFVNQQSPLWAKGGITQMFIRIKTRMGYALRTSRYRFVAWVKVKNESDVLTPHWNSIEMMELYDHDSDPYENVNIAQYDSARGIVTEHLNRLKAGWAHEMGRSINQDDWFRDDNRKSEMIKHSMIEQRSKQGKENAINDSKHQSDFPMWLIKAAFKTVFLLVLIYLLVKCSAKTINLLLRCSLMSRLRIK